MRAGSEHRGLIPDAADARAMTIGRDRVTANGLSFEYRHAGDPDGRLALCLHGFPDDAGSFDPLLERLAAAGYRAVAPYMRGYGPTDRAPNGDYSAGALGRDALALAGELDGGDGDPVLVGHDWGAAAGYVAAYRDPDAFDDYALLSVPPHFGHRLREHPRQQLRSWYVYLFQIPGTERLVRAADFALIEFLWGTWSPGWDYPEERIEDVKTTFRSPGTVTAALEYYRQSPPYRTGDSKPAPVPVDALLAVGARDGCIAPTLFRNADEGIAGDCRALEIRGAGHFLHAERPDVLAEELLAWFER